MAKRLILPTGLILGIVMVGLLSVSFASAENSENYPPIVKRIAEKFNLKESDVQAVFDEERQERYAQKMALLKEKLDDLVKDGKITSDQREAILKKYDEMHDKIFELEDLDPKEKRKEILKLRSEFKAWAKEENISLPMLTPFGFGFKKGFFRGYMFGLTK